MIDLEAETLLSLKEAARKLPPGRRGRPVNLSTVYRWVLGGAKSSDGTKVRLDAVRVGGRWLTSTQALQRFAQRLTEQALPGTQEATQPKSASPRPSAAEAARQELSRLGI